MLAEFDLSISYGQVLVFLPTLARPGLIKTDEHIAQGFAWAPEIVSFSIPDHDGICRLRIALGDRMIVDAGAIWALSVPFDVPISSVEIGTVADMRGVVVPAGPYRLVFQALPRPADCAEEVAFLIDLRFCPPGDPPFAILKRGGEIATDVVLTTTAQYA